MCRLAIGCSNIFTDKIKMNNIIYVSLVIGCSIFLDKIIILIQIFYLQVYIISRTIVINPIVIFPT